MKQPRLEPWNRPWSWAAVIWILLLCFLPDPRPLATPAWSIKLVKAALHVQDPAARVIAAIALRMIFLGLLGILVARASNARRFDRNAWIALLVAPCLGLLTLWVNHGYFPLNAQLKLAIIATLAGVLVTFVLRRNWWAGGALLVVLGLTYGQLANYSVEDDLALATRAQVGRLLAIAPDLPDGDEGFLQLSTAAFALAQKRSEQGDPVLENQAAVLALALVLGDEKLAKVADRYVDPAKVAACEELRARTTLHLRPDWSRHFWVSAGLVVLSGESRSLNVGLIKELKDANAGGSGFSFGDLTADACGDRFALAATRDVPGAVAMQHRMKEGVKAADLMPAVQDLPEGIHVDEFEEHYGGAGGARTDSLVQVIRQRMEACALLR